MPRPARSVTVPAQAHLDRPPPGAWAWFAGASDSRPRRGHRGITLGGARRRSISAGRWAISLGRCRRSLSAVREGAAAAKAKRLGSQDDSGAWVEQLIAAIGEPSQSPAPFVDHHVVGLAGQ